MKKLIAFTVLVIAMLAAACTPGQPGAALAAAEWLAGRLGVEVGQIEIVGAEEVDWSDSCLELGGPAESCLAAVTPGWLITLEVNGETYEIHTDANASVIRLAGDQPSAPGSGQLEGTNWALTGFGGPGEESPIQLVLPDAPVTLSFQAGGIMGGSGGCNSYGGNYMVDGSTIAFDQIVTTEMACLAEGVMDQEAKYYAALASAQSFELTDGGLRIWYDGGALFMDFVPLVES